MRAHEGVSKHIPPDTYIASSSLIRYRGSLNSVSMKNLRVHANPPSVLSPTKRINAKKRKAIVIGQLGHNRGTTGTRMPIHKPWK